METYKNSTNLNIGYYEKYYSLDDAPFEIVDIVDVIRENEQQNIGYITNIKMELYPVTTSYFYINDKKIKTFDGSYESPMELDIYSLKIEPYQSTSISIIYYYYL